MKQKYCIKCKQFKSISEFKLNVKGESVLRLDGTPRQTNVCWGCRSFQRKATYLTLEGRLRYIYKHQTKNSKSRGHNPPEYSEQQLIKKFIKDISYIHIYNNWKSSGFRSELMPSIDRLRDEEGYSFDNIRMTTWKENNSKEHSKHKAGTSVNEDLKPTWQYTMKGEFVNCYISQNEAARQVESITQQTVSLCCKGEINSSGNFRWFYKEQFNLEPIEDYQYYSKIYEYCPITKQLLNTYSSIDSIADRVNEQVSIRRAIRNNKLYKERLFSLEELDRERIQNIIKNTKGVSAISVYNLEYKKIGVYKSANQASKALGLADTTIKRYTVSKKPYKNYLFRLKFDDEIAEQNTQHLNVLKD